MQQLSPTPLAKSEFEYYDFGICLKRPEITAFFGNRQSSYQLLSETFPDQSFYFLRQVHSNLCRQAEDQLATQQNPLDLLTWIAGLPVSMSIDAAWTQTRRLALCIRTADCMPVLFYCAKTPMVAAAHAGWRGLADGILAETLRAMVRQGAPLSSIHVFIGPHIGPKSFEVGSDVAEKLLSIHDDLPPPWNRENIVFPHVTAEKRYVHLETMARAQICSEGVNPLQVSSFAIDTARSIEHCSFRRDGGSAERQLSFICLGPQE